MANEPVADRGWRRKQLRDNFIRNLFDLAKSVAKNEELDRAIVDTKPECLHFWLRGLSTTEAGEHIGPVLNF